MTVASGLQIKVADEVWIATALLHREHEDRADFQTISSSRSLRSHCPALRGESSSEPRPLSDALRDIAGAPPPVS
jgi:hypothetical protein